MLRNKLFPLVICLVFSFSRINADETKDDNSEGTRTNVSISVNEIAEAAGKDMSLIYYLYKHGEKKIKIDEATINEVKKSVEYIISKAPLFVPNNLSVGIDNQTLKTIIAAINSSYNEYIQYSDKQADIKTLKKYYNKTLDEKNGLLHALNVTHQAFVFNENDTILNYLSNNIQTLNPTCEATISEQQYYFNYVIHLLTLQYKAYHSLEYSYKLKTDIDPSPGVTAELINMRDRVYYFIQMLAFTAEDLLSNTNKTMWKCDPDKHQENVTYTELKNVFRKIFYSSSDFERDYNIETCSGSCPGITLREVVTPKCKNCLLPQRPCSNVKSCERTRDISVCVKKSQDSGSRYTYARHPKDNDPGQCETGEKYLAYNTFDGKCHYCTCICEETEHSERFISLKSAQADIESNRVVTGVRFVKERTILYLQVQHGKLLPGGFINNETLEWVPLNYSSFIPPTTLSVDYDEFNMFGGKYLFELNYDNRRGVHLDDIELCKNDVVTGIKFERHQRGIKTVLLLSVRATPFDFLSGKLNPSESRWVNQNELDRTKFQVTKTTDSAILLDVKNELQSYKSKYIEFSTSGVGDTLDAGQTTVPLIDIQPVVSDPPTPLGGLGIDVKNVPNKSAGFLTLKTQSYSIVHNLL